MSKKAFPKSRTVNQDGMDLRDYFAGQALQGLLASENDGHCYNRDTLAALAYDLSDDMMKVREDEND